MKKHNYTNEDIQELIECRDNFQHFALTYFNIETTLDLLDFNSFTDLRTFNPNVEEFKVLIVWYALFQRDRLIVITSDLQKESITILTDIMEKIKSLPPFLQPGFVEQRMLGVLLDNNNRIICVTCNGCSCRGMTISLGVVFRSEYVQIKKLDDFLKGILPTMHSGFAKMILL